MLRAMTLAIGQPAPDFTLRNQDFQKVTLSDFDGRKRLIVFIPLAFTSTCEGELCTIRDNLHALAERDTQLFVITCDNIAVNKSWAEAQRFDFPILSDFWPHGAVTQAYDCFDERIGVPIRATYTVDEHGTITEVFSTETLDIARNFDDYVGALDRI
jgi:peroxiredoxin (alkyl hydroperoxide reductase subunit C)